MTGVLTNAGVLQNGQLSDAAFDAYVDDVLEALKSGKSSLPFDFPCSQTLTPTPGAEFINLKDKASFPDFHNIWRPRYENMVKSLDVEGNMPLTPIFDPTAAATKLGLETPDMKLPDIISYIIVPGKLAADLPTGKLFPELANPDKLIEVQKKLPGLSIPTPPMPQVTIPDANLQVNGYTDQYDYEVKLGLSPYLSHVELTKKMLDIPTLTKALTNLPAGLIQMSCEVCGANAPKPPASGPMETSSVEIAASQVLLQHQVKFSALVALGGTVGNGALIKGLAATPISAGGMGLIKEPSAKAPSPWVGEVPSGEAKVPGHHIYGRQIILDASQNIYPKRKLNTIEIQAIQGVAALESSYGKAKIMNVEGTQKLNNWGGVQCPKGSSGPNCVLLHDKYPNGKTFSVSFRSYPTPADGCADTIRHILFFRPRTAALLAAGPASSNNPESEDEGATFFRFSYIMRRDRYYGGFCKNAFKEYGDAVGGIKSLEHPDSNDACKACAKEAVEGHVQAMRQNLDQALASNALNEPYAMPLGTYEDADAWYHKKYGYNA